ncbi:hypothetical protein AAIB41_15285 [Brucella sp. BE17]|uniref:hypothetical protein n=1 Tax=Brucella sp. BE17 TaxID=3142977 RepID=UPI0031BB3EE0
MKVATSPFSEALRGGANKGQQIGDLVRQLVELMSETHGQAYRADINHGIGYVLIAQKGGAQ